MWSRNPRARPISFRGNLREIQMLTMGRVRAVNRRGPQVCQVSRRQEPEKVDAVLDQIAIDWMTSGLLRGAEGDACACATARRPARISTVGFQPASAQLIAASIEYYAVITDPCRSRPRSIAAANVFPPPPPVVVCQSRYRLCAPGTPGPAQCRHRNRATSDPSTTTRPME